jgi:hypothetical protein
MRVLRSVAQLLLLVTAAVPAVAQQTQVQFNSAGSTVAYGVYVGPYRGTLISEPGSPMIDLYCVDYYNSIRFGQTYTANVSNLAGSLANTRWGQTFSNPADARMRYQMAAWLSTQFASHTSNNNAAWGGIHAAIWNIFTPGAGGWSAVAAAQPWLLLARQNYASIDLRGWAAVTDVRTVGGRGGVQEFLTPVNVTPEPATMLMLGTGLVALVGAMYRRREV